MSEGFLSRTRPERRSAAPVAVWLSISLGSLVVSTLPARAEEVIVRVSFDQVYDEISPTARMNSSRKVVEARLGANGEIHSVIDTLGVKKSTSGGYEQKIGPRSGGHEWRVVGKDKLLFVARYKTFKRAILVTVQGKTCIAQVDFDLDPGASDYRHPTIGSGEAIARSVAAQNLTCSIASQ
jgi:hypothetical protein